MPRSLISIGSMDQQGAKRFIAEALQLGPDKGELGSAVASIDWSRLDAADPEVVRLLGAFDGAVTAYEEGDASWEATAAELRELAAPPGRRASA